MGDAADDMFNMELLFSIEREEEARFWKAKGYWTTYDSRKIKFAELKDNHLLSIEKMLRRNRKLTQWPEIKKEIKKRGLK